MKKNQLLMKNLLESLFTNYLKYLEIHDFNVKKVYIDKLDDIVNEYSHTYHRTIKMKPVNVKSNTNIDLGIEDNEEYPNLRLAIM